jgi:hypothetical protein
VTGTPVRKVLAALVITAVVGAAALVGARLMGIPLGVGEPPGAGAPVALASQTPAVTPRPGCFDPAAPVEPVVVTNPQGPRGEPPDGYPFVIAARSLPTFAGIWVNEFRRQFHIAVSCDIDGAIAALGPTLPRDREVHFHLVQYTYAELEAIRDRIFADHNTLMSEGIFISSGGIDESGNRARIGIDPLTEAIVAEMKRRYGDPIEFEHMPRPEPLPQTWPTEPEVLVAAIAPDDIDRLVTCDSPPFPAALLDGPDVADVPDDLAEALAAAVQFWRSEFAGLEGHAWRLIHRDEAAAHFVARDEDGWLHIGLRSTASGWEPRGMGECTPVAALDGFGPASWSLDPAYPAPGPEALELHVLVHERACSGGTPAFGRMAAPLVEYGSDALTVTIGVRPRPGMNTCQGNPPTPATIILPQPLGDRGLLDGGREPPGPPLPDF